MNQRIERVGTITSAQIHDLKNRLTVIKGVAQLLGRQVRRADWEQDRIVARVDQLQQEIIRLELMIDGLMTGGNPLLRDTADEPKTTVYDA